MGKDEEASKSLLENLRAIQMRQLKQPEVGADGQPVEMGSVELVGLKDDDLDDDFIVGEDTREEVYEYIPDFHRNFDYCLVFPLVIKIGYGYELTQESVELTVKLKKLGAILFPYLSFQKDELFVLIRFPVDKLKRFAEKSEFVFALDPVVAEEKAAEGNEELKIAPIEIPFDKKISSYHPFLYMYGRYSSDVDEALYWRPEGVDHPFRPIVRIKLTKLIMQGAPRIGGGGIVLAKLIEKGVIVGAFPLHEEVQRVHLLHLCIRPINMPWNMPFAELNE